MADPLERVTNLATLLLHTRVPLVAEQIFFALGDAYPDDEQSRHTMFERDKRMLRDAGVPLQALPWPTPRAAPATASTPTSGSCPSSTWRPTSGWRCTWRWRPCTSGCRGATPR